MPSRKLGSRAVGSGSLENGWRRWKSIFEGSDGARKARAECSHVEMGCRRFESVSRRFGSKSNSVTNSHWPRCWTKWTGRAPPD